MVNKTPLADEQFEDPNYWDQVSDRYDSLYFGEFDRYENMCTLQVLQGIFGKYSNPRLLDIGCGTGLGFELLSLSGLPCIYTGIDSSLKMLEQFKSKFPAADCKLLDASDVRSLSRKFDVIIALNGVFSYVDEAQSALEYAAECLSDDGCLFVSFFNRYSFRRLSRFRFGSNEPIFTRNQSQFARSQMLQVFSIIELKKLTQKLGLQNVNVSSVSPLGGVWQSRASIKWDKLIQASIPYFGHQIQLFATKSGGVLS
jgi:SAM-dependent methyltransferase